jgi:DNA-binding beta-propeller fold protein YncE
VVFDGTHIWVVNAGGNIPPTQQPSVTELNASTGAWVQTLSGESYSFVSPEAAAFDGGHIWVVNSNGNSVTEFNASNGAWVRTLA